MSSPESEPGAWWLDRLRSGDPVAFEEFVARYEEQLRPRVQRLITNDLRPQVETQCLLDSVFMNAPELLDSFEYRSDGELLAYLIRVVAYKVADRRKRERAQKRGGGRRLPPGSVADAVIAAKSDSITRPSMAAARGETSDRLQDALTELKEEQREVLILRYFDGRTLREIGEAIGTSEDAARMRVARAEAALAKVYRKRME